LGLPAKKARKEIRRLANVATSDFEVNYRLTHDHFLQKKMSAIITLQGGGDVDRK
jgi:hypothetical protein